MRGPLSWQDAAFLTTQGGKNVIETCSSLGRFGYDLHVYGIYGAGSVGVAIDGVDDADQRLTNPECGIEGQLKADRIDLRLSQEQNPFVVARLPRLLGWAILRLDCKGPVKLPDSPFLTASELVSQIVVGATTSFAYNAWGRMTSKSDGMYSTSYTDRCISTMTLGESKWIYGSWSPVVMRGRQQMALWNVACSSAG